MQKLTSLLHITFVATLALALASCVCPPAQSTYPPPGSTTGQPAQPTQPDPNDPRTSQPPANPDTNTGTTTGTPTTPPTSEPTAEQRPGMGTPCTEQGLCADGLQCVTYYGIAGPNGPKFTSCEIPCGANPQACPEGHKCVTIADGPGQVCRLAR